MGAQLVKEVATKTNDVAGDGTTTATVLAQALVHEGLRNVAAGANPTSLKRGIDKAVTAVVEAIKDQAKEIDDKSEIAQVAAISAADASIGEVLADAIDKVGKDGVVTVEESNTFGLGARVHRGHAVRQGLSVAVLRDRPGAPGDRPRRPVHPDRQLQDQRRPRPGSGPREGHAGRQAAPDHRRGRRGRGPGHPGGQQDPGDVHLRRRQGPRLRRPAQGHARATSPPSPAASSSPRRSASSSRTPPSTCWAGPARSSSTRTTPPSSRAPGPRATSRAASPRSSARSRTPTPTGTGRSSRSAWPSSPAASPSSRSAPPPRWSSRRRSTASRTPCPPPGRPSRRASCRWRRRPAAQPGQRRQGDLVLDRRRGDRRRHRPQGAGGAPQVDRLQRRPRGLGDHRARRA